MFYYFKCLTCQQEECLQELIEGWYVDKIKARRSDLTYQNKFLYYLLSYIFTIFISLFEGNSQL